MGRRWYLREGLLKAVDKIWPGIPPRRFFRHKSAPPTEGNMGGIGVLPMPMARVSRTFWSFITPPPALLHRVDVPQSRAAV